MLIASTPDDALHPVFVPADYAGSCFIGFAMAIAGRVRAAHDGRILARRMDIDDSIEERSYLTSKADDAPNPGVIADCTATT